MRQTQSHSRTGGASGGCSGFGIWVMFSLLHLFTTKPDHLDKLEVFWRLLAGPINWLA